MGAPIHGKNGLIYISGSELVGANAWSIDMGMETAEAPKFGDTWKQHVPGLLTWSGSISAWEQTDEKLLVDAATANVAVALIIYPNRNDLTDYYSGNAIFGASADASVTTAVAKNGNFTGDGQLTIVGFA